jgi:hypothetical protein
MMEETTHRLQPRIPRGQHLDIAQRGHARVEALENHGVVDGAIHKEVDDPGQVVPSIVYVFADSLHVVGVPDRVIVTMMHGSGHRR